MTPEQECFVQILKGYENGVLRQINDTALKASLEYVIHDGPLITFDCFSTVYRGRKLERRGTPYSELSDMLAKPCHLVGQHGRCNLPNQSMLYVANHLQTLFPELRASEGDQIQIVELTPQNAVPIRALWIGAIDHFRRHGEFPKLLRPHTDQALGGLEARWQGSDPSVREYDQYVDAFFAHVFRGEERETANHSFYKLTSVYSDILFENAVNLEGVIYPSVQQLGGWNIAVKPEITLGRYNVARVSVHEFEKDLGYGMFRTSEIMSTTNTHDNDIVW